MDAARTARVLNTMTQAEAAKANGEQPRAYFRVDTGKANYASAEMATWLHIAGELLPNGDDVGVVTPWHFPGALEGVLPVHIGQVRERAASGQYRADSRSEDWIGNLVAEVLDLDIKDDAKHIKAILKTWFEDGTLRKVERDDAGR
jgi:hypothetical protein